MVACRQPVKPRLARGFSFQTRGAGPGALLLRPYYHFRPEVIIAPVVIITFAPK